MASPVVSSDLGNFSEFGDLCERVTRLMGGLDQLKLFLDYLVDSDGEFTQAVRSLGLLPPGVVVAYSTTTSSFDAAKAEVEKIGRTAADIASGTGPLWRICDGTNGTDDLRGRTIFGVNDTADNGLTIRANKALIGSETVVLTEAQLPAHSHGDIVLGNGSHGMGSSITSDPCRVLVNDASADSGTATIEDSTTGDTGAGEGHPNIPPAICYYWIVRTSRVF